jgi:murein L,D-transpeptidase YafK
MALPIDYPNELDRKEGNGGYGIWFHGTNEPLKPRDTNGCIVLENRNITELAGYVKLHETPVIITPKLELVDSEDIKRESQVLKKVINHWRRSWEKKDISRYMGTYSPGFTARGMDWHQWKKYKESLANRYAKIEVKISNLQFLKAKGVILAKFEQTYRTPVFESQGEKRLYLTKNSNEWKIIGEFFEKGKIRRKAVVESPKPALLKEIEQFIETWKNAWEQKDLNTYIGAYDSEFRSRGMDIRTWKRYKAGLNKKCGSLKIMINQLKITQNSDHIVQVRFRQEYHADTYQDSGTKDLYLIKRGNNWKIKKEMWRPTTMKNPL